MLFLKSFGPRLAYRTLKCQGLAGPWYARREREAVKAKVQWFNGLVTLDEGTSPN